MFAESEMQLYGEQTLLRGKFSIHSSILVHLRIFVDISLLGLFWPECWKVNRQAAEGECNWLKGDAGGQYVIITNTEEQLTLKCNQ